VTAPRVNRERVCLRVPKDLLSQVDARARRSGLTRSAALVAALAAGLDTTDHTIHRTGTQHD
jgi:metal-responsive CopG/Arc/MetJ family transcriptional regulator